MALLFADGSSPDDTCGYYSVLGRPIGKKIQHMIFQAMELIRQNLNAFIAASGGIPAVPEPVVLGNIAYATPDNPATPAVDESAQVYMSLVNVDRKSVV